MKVGIKIALALVAGFFTINNTAQAQKVNDKELKKNVAPVANSINYITKLEPLSYEYDHNKYKQLSLPDGQQFGFMADDVKQVLPGVITRDNKWVSAGKNNQRAITTEHVDLEKIVPLLVGAIKEQQAQIEKLQADISTLKANSK